MPENENPKYVVISLLIDNEATKEQIEEEMFRFVGNLGEFYYYMGVRFQKHQNPNRRGRKKKNI